MPKNNSNVKEKALDLISLHIGDVTAQMYSQLYDNKKAEFIVHSVYELLAQLLGKNKAQQEIKSTYPNLKLDYE